MFSSNGGKSTIKLQLESPSPSPLTATTTTLPPSPGRRRRHRGAAARARRRQRAADHQASLAQAATSVPLVPPCRPLHILPSPPPASGRRRVVSVERSDMPTFSSINLDGSSSPTSTPAPPSSPPSQPVCYAMTTATSMSDTAKPVEGVSFCALSMLVVLATQLQKVFGTRNLNTTNFSAQFAIVCSASGTLSRDIYLFVIIFSSIV